MKKKAKSKNIKEEIEVVVNELLEKLQVEGKVNVTEETGDTEGDTASSYRITIESEESGLLIGHHGETINSLQLILGVILYKKSGKWMRVILDVGDYRKMREETIKEMVNRIVTEVEDSGKPVELPYLSPLERRIVHMMLTDHKNVRSESSGEGKDRRVTIKPR
ncbi:hypothetical protein A3D05_02265 [Candidatus Gottesmanbacteria bacterium RIFCSPHIGHO2_02_FULL_40_24]|uniref:R3H domain-containing protein n=1 Tax=Candidatus Gottesmanbacteria bacterium RIFCSPHIGHO2_01_FULL_40_15 TaxID=1798376 RepID=A0A1F5Z4G3_9BACT|nr:MAG: hypothetical protein A2777_03990 [Candidatus Gottesmanbacteria bacterium RIFCSPHIGHO2_01_FULL_40_15]OGG18677.1 MAG: hypothetical protein A3D05_02265 [Candidatus Gottesmanbacteria bacterium RIFCSPHIGHO2_02_FULL_40_24]OGG22780.1 MAG: hypothetical protein A3B48_05300 [Candidatus Gottesmanbacteria bacterium RIFCSPLOWO2_01_FULL_40_10]OGG22969.1 MAG: hypothetical protein A3E42_06470 [Candidatus Gottesmanbacteria bacterium RIFCSPHIGHO2_12_FULL_40_13]OGG31888.1 MAG: hypothetical protein A3I80_0